MTYDSSYKRQTGRLRQGSLDLQSTFSRTRSNTTSSRKQSVPNDIQYTPQATRHETSPPFAIPPHFHTPVHGRRTDSNIGEAPVGIEAPGDGDNHDVRATDTTASNFLEEEKEVKEGKMAECGSPNAKFSSLSDLPMRPGCPHDDPPCRRPYPRPRKKSLSQLALTARTSASSLEKSKSPEPFKSHPQADKISSLVLRTAGEAVTYKRWEQGSKRSAKATLAYKEFLGALFESLCFIKHMAAIKDEYIVNHIQSIPRPIGKPGTHLVCDHCHSL